MKKRYLKIKQWLLLTTLTAIGFTSCEKDQPVMYGSPTAKHSIKTKVTNKNEQPIQGINVIVRNGNSYVVDSTFTDSKGEVTTTDKGFPRQTYTIDFKDIDSVSNGAYKDTSITVSFENSQYTGASGAWYVGEAEKNINIVMKNKETDN